MQVLTDPRAMQAWSDAERAAGRTIALVPTMGALHSGHMTLVAEARTRAERVVVSIFVNPIQFDRRDDFEKYPRTFATDGAMCEEASVDAIYAPTAASMYPEGFATGVEVAGLTAPLCGAARPGHFKGVTTVVAKLFHAVRPHVTVFGEKDYQQLAVVRRMVADLDFGIDVVGVPTVREPDGLALSSRNRRLDPAARRAAVCIPRALDVAGAAVAGGETSATALVDRAAKTIAAEPAVRLEYCELRDPVTLGAVDDVTAPAVLAIAAWVGGVRLIDNRVLVPGEGH